MPVKLLVAFFAGRENRSATVPERPERNLHMHCTKDGRMPCSRALEVNRTFPFQRIALAVIVAACACALTAAPSAAWAQDASSDVASAGSHAVSGGTVLGAQAFSSLAKSVADVCASTAQSAEVAKLARTRILDYDPALIAQVGNQMSSGHWGCCPCFSCAYGDAVIYGVANSHTQYGCGMCTWPGWGGGNSSFRSLGNDQALLREAYDSIAAGKPTVIHLSGESGQHWVCMIGYQDVTDPDNLTLGNFVALDPVDGAQITVSSRYWLYGDQCEHVSDAL